MAHKFKTTTAAAERLLMAPFQLVAKYWVQCYMAVLDLCISIFLSTTQMKDSVDVYQVCKWHNTANNLHNRRFHFYDSFFYSNGLLLFLFIHHLDSFDKKVAI